MLWVGTGQGLAVLGALVGVRLMTELLDPASYGQLALGMTGATLVQQVFVSPLGATCQRFFSPSQEAGQFWTYLRVFRVLTVRVLAGLMVLIVGGVIVTVAMGLVDWLPLLLAAALFAVISGGNSLFANIQTAARHRQLVALHKAAAEWGRFAVAVGLVLLLGSTSTVAMLGFALGSVAVLTSHWFFFRTTILPKDRDSVVHDEDTFENWKRQMQGYTWPFATWGVLTWALVASDRWALQTFATTNSVGYYVVLYQLGYFSITMLCTLMMEFLSPILFSRAGDNTDARRNRNVASLVNRLTWATCLLTVLATMSAFALHNHVFWLLVAREYREVSWLLPWIVLSGGLFASGQTASLLAMSSTDSKQLMPVKIVTAVLGIAFSISGAYWFGIRGVVGGNVMFSSIYFVWMFSLVRRPSGTCTRLSANATM